MGPNTLKVPMELFALNRRRLRDRLRNNGVVNNAIILLQGGDIQNFYDTDTEYNVFRQVRSNFAWLGYYMIDQIMKYSMLKTCLRVSTTEIQLTDETR